MTVLARDGTLHALLPPGVAVCTESDPTAAEPLFPSEQAAIRDAVASRQREFALGRTCARRALRRLGAEACPIGVGTMREPVWPEGIVGSITHCASFWAAAVARRAELRGLGIDVADNRPLEPAVRNLIAAGGDEAALMESADPDVAWDVVLFSVKEAVFKAWWPVHRSWLESTDVCISLNRADGTFRAAVQPDGGDCIGVLRGRFAVDGDLVFSAAIVP